MERGYKLRPMNVTINQSEYDDAHKLLFVREGSNMGTAIDLTDTDLNRLYDVIGEYFDSQRDTQLIPFIEKYAGGTITRVVNLCEGDKILHDDEWCTITDLDFRNDKAHITLLCIDGKTPVLIRDVNMGIVKK